MVSISAFYVALSSDWCAVIIYDFPKLRNVLFSTHRDRALRRRCQGNLKFRQGIIRKCQENLFHLNVATLVQAGLC